MDHRIAGIRLNSAMVNKYTLDNELELTKSAQKFMPLYFDIKGRQLRVTEPIVTPDHLELKLNYPIKVETPTMVLFKAGEDYALLKEVKGNHLIFEGGPRYLVHEGESLHIRHPSLEVYGPFFNEFEIEKIEKAKEAGFKRFFLSYVENKRCVDEFRELVGKESMIIAKIENKKGLEYVANDYKPEKNLSLMAARGDLYVEVDKPHHILNALKLIVSKEPDAYAGSRMLLSTINRAVPDCSDISELAWLYDVGYRHLMLCDELCLKGDMLGRAINVFESFRQSYVNGLNI